ncbi:hypothetical protein P9112_008950 [Eukaryota sp. TZLM1-RC]
MAQASKPPQNDVPVSFPVFKLIPSPAYDLEKQQEAQQVLDFLISRRLSPFFISSDRSTTDHFQRYSNKYFTRTSDSGELLDYIKPILNSNFYPPELISLRKPKPRKHTDSSNDLTLDEIQHQEETSEAELDLNAELNSADDADDYGTVYQDFEDGDDVGRMSGGEDEPAF